MLALSGVLIHSPSLIISLTPKSDDGGVLSWGGGVGGRLGHGSTSVQRLPKQIEALRGVTVTGIACGPIYSAAVDGMLVSLVANGF
jgi:RCC1 and BTB domain-containing protein